MWKFDGAVWLSLRPSHFMKIHTGPVLLALAFGPVAGAVPSAPEILAATGATGGLVVANGSLFVATEDGKVVGFGGK